MTNEPQENGENYVAPPENARAVTCALCTHVNAPGRGTCKKCGAHLYVRCKDCGERNARIQPMCLHCGRKLHRSELSKFRSKFDNFTTSYQKTLIWVVAAIALVGLAYAVVVGISNLSLKDLR